MNKSLFILINLLLGGNILWAQSVPERLDSLLKASSFLQTTTVGIHVVDLDNGGRTEYAYQSEKIFRPASTLKLLTTIAAGDLLGTDYRFSTEVAYSGMLRNDTLLGNLYLKGGLDPELSVAELNTLAEAVYAKGIRYIKGNVFGDVSLMDATYFGPGWCWDDAPSDYQPYISPLVVNKGCLDVNVLPMSAGKTAYVEVMPMTSHLTIDNRTTTIENTSKETPLLQFTSPFQVSQSLTVSGQIGQPYHFSRAVVDSKILTLGAFIEMLYSMGMLRDNRTLLWGRVPKDARVIASTEHTLLDAVHSALKHSDNLSAEALFLSIGRLSARNEATSFDFGAERIGKYVKKYFESEREAFRIVDGSGLSLYNYVRPTLLTSLLRRLYAHRELYDAYLPCFPLAGIDGTLSTRMRSGSATGKVWAKTGTVTGVSTLSGFVQTKNGGHLAFVVMMNGVLDSRKARAWQDRFCEILAE